MPRKLRQLIFAVQASLVLLFLSPLAAAANPATDAVNAFFDWAKATGATVAEYGALEETGPSDAILRDARLEWQFNLTLGDGQLALTIAAHAPQTHLEGAAADDLGVAFTRFEQPGAHEITVTGSYVEDGNTTPIDLTLRQHDLVAENYYQAYLTISDDPQRPVSRFFDALVAGLDTRVDRTEIRLIESISRMPDGQAGTERYEGYVFTDVTNGRMDTLRVERTVAETTMPLNNADDGGEMLTIRQETGPQVTRGVDTMPMLRLLGILPADADVGNTLIESLEFRDAKITVDGLLEDATVSGGLAEFRLDNMSIDPDATPFDIGALLDQWALGTLDLDEAATITLMREGLTAIEALSTARLDFDGLVVSAPTVNATLDRIAMRDASYRGFSEFLISGLAIAASQDNITVGLGSFRLSDLTLAPLGDYLDFAMESASDTPDISKILPVIPMLGGLEIAKLAVTSDDLAAPVEIDRHELRMRDFIAPIPTDIEARTEGAQFPVTMIEDATAQGIFERLGMTSIRYSDETRLRWDEATDRLTLSPLAFAIEGGGSMELALELGGIPRLVFENPQQAQLALATATVIKARLEIRDARMIDAFIAEQAAAAGLSPETLALGLADTAIADLGPLQDTSFGRNLHAALKTFLVSPDHLIITAEPDTPVPVTQILGLFATTPTMLPDLLNFAVAANP